MAGSPFTFHCAGTTVSSGASYNSSNEVAWGTSSNPAAIATTYFWYNTITDTLLECDVIFNDAHNFGDGASNSFFDIQTIMVHEFGHWLNLRDIYGDIGDGIHDSAKIMYGFGSEGVVKRRLHSADISGIRWIYGTEATAMPWIPLLLLSE